MMNMNEPVELARFLNVREAEFVCSVLEGSGIEAYIDQPFTGSIAPHYMFGSGGVRVFVRSGNRERAIEVLQAIQEQVADEDSEDE